MYNNIKLIPFIVLSLILIFCLAGCNQSSNEIEPTAPVPGTSAAKTTFATTRINTAASTQTSPDKSSPSSVVSAPSAEPDSATKPASVSPSQISPVTSTKEPAATTPAASTPPSIPVEDTTTSTPAATSETTTTPAPTTATATSPSPSPETSRSSGGGGGGSTKSYKIIADLFGSIYSISTTSQGKVKSTFEATSDDGHLTITIPEDTYALESDGDRLRNLTAEIVSDAVEAEGTNIITPVYTFGEEGATFDPPITFTYFYNLEDYPDVAEDLVYFASYESETGTWTEIDEGVTLNKTRDTVTTSISHFSTYGVIGHTTRTITDMYGSELVIPAVINRVLSGGPVETQLIYMLAPDKLCAINGNEATPFWKSSWDGTEAFIPAEYNNLPDIGSWSSNPASFEAAIAADPDIVLEGKTKNLDNYREQFGSIPVVGVNAGASLCWDFADEIEYVGDLLGVPDKAQELLDYYQEAMDYVNGVVGGFRGESINDEDGPEKIRVYYAENADGLGTDAKGSWHTNLLWFCGGANVADVEVQSTSSIVAVDMEQIIGWEEEDPIDMIILGRSAVTSTYYDIMASDLWQVLDCVQRGEVYIRPQNPTSWFDGPPGYGQIIGMYWLVDLLYNPPDLNLSQKIQEFYSKFLHYDLSSSEVANLLSQPE
ncbi:MAG: ABC transporter substrate-binding protein [Dehalococcoidales bacterium]|nr:ABC transporter substrate-binding protein [Dehalococcoidales bacterium]